MYNKQSEVSDDVLLSEFENIHSLDERSADALAGLCYSHLHFGDTAKVLRYTDKLAALGSLYFNGFVLFARAAGGMSNGNDLFKMEQVKRGMGHYPPYFQLPNIICALRLNDFAAALEFARLLDNPPSVLSRSILLAVKQKLQPLSAEEQRYVLQNSHFFSEPYLALYLNDQAPKIAFR